jgi:hypothetical protein
MDTTLGCMFRMKLEDFEDWAKEAEVVADIAAFKVLFKEAELDPEGLDKLLEDIAKNNP